MAFILSIETSTSGCSVAIHKNGSLVGCREIQEPYSAAARLIVQINELFIDTGESKNSIEAVAISAGPGSYTGLRIGAATAKGICFALDRPLIALDSLHVLAAGILDPGVSSLLCPMIDARRMEVYCCLLTPTLQIIEDSHPRVIDENSYTTWLAGRSIEYFGNGAEKCRSWLPEPNARYREGISAHAADMGKLAIQKFESKEFADVRAFEPRYLKDFVAKTKTV